MSGLEGNNDNSKIYIIGGVVTVSIIFIIIAVVLYYYYGEDTDTSGNAGLGDSDPFSEASINARSEAYNAAIQAAEDALSAEGLDGIVDFSNPQIELSSVEIDSGSGTKTVAICNNEIYRPLYFNKQLKCFNDMALVTNSDKTAYCCSYGDIDTLTDKEQIFLMGYLKTFMEFTQDPDNFNTEVIMALVVTDLMSFGIVKNVLKSLGKTLGRAALSPFLANKVGHSTNAVVKAINKSSIAGNALSNSTAAVNLEEKLLEKASEEVLVAEAGEATELGAEKLIKKSGIKALGHSLGVFFNIEMIFEFVGWFLQQYDVGGFKQYQDNKTTILQQRDLYQGIVLSAFRSMGIEAPLYFNLYDLKQFIHGLESASGTSASGTSAYTPSVCPDNSTTEGTLSKDIKKNILKDISNAYSAAFSMYHTSLGAFKKNLDIDDKNQIAQHIQNGTTPSKTFLDRVSPHINDNPKDRDDYIWDTLKRNLNKELNMNGEIPKYINYYEKFTDTNVIGISLNQSGANIINSLNDTYSIIITKYYRDIDTTQVLGPEAAEAMGTDKLFILKQKKLDQNEEFPLIDYSAPLLKKYCTEGMDPDKLPGKEMRAQHGHVFSFLTDPELQIHPCLSGVTYNEDTGLCNYEQPWCTEMGFTDIKTENMRGISEMNTYKNCDIGMGEAIAEGILPELAIQGFVRATG